jgi:hypothetical protein
VQSSEVDLDARELAALAERDQRHDAVRREPQTDATRRDRAVDVDAAKRARGGTPNAVLAAPLGISRAHA